MVSGWLLTMAAFAGQWLFLPESAAEPTVRRGGQGGWKELGRMWSARSESWRDDLEFRRMGSG